MPRWSAKTPVLAEAVDEPEVSGEAVKVVSGYFTGLVVFHSATVTLEDSTLCAPLRVTDPCDEGDLRHLFGLVVHNRVSIIDDLRGERR